MTVRCFCSIIDVVGKHRIVAASVALVRNESSCLRLCSTAVSQWLVATETRLFSSVLLFFFGLLSSF